MVDLQLKFVDATEETINACQTRSREAIIFHVKMMEHDIPMELDKGAAVSVISKDTFKRTSGGKLNQTMPDNVDKLHR